MSILLDRPPHKVTVQKKVRTQGLRGAYHEENDGEPIEVACMVQAVREWSTEEELVVDGLQVLTLARIFSRTWPGDVNSIVTWDGYEWETVGEPQHFQVSRRTEHWSITVRRRGAA